MPATTSLPPIPALPDSLPALPPLGSASKPLLLAAASLAAVLPALHLSRSARTISAIGIVGLACGAFASQNAGKLGKLTKTFPR